MKTDSSNVTMGPGGSSERALVDSAWRQVERLGGRTKSLGSLDIPGFRILGEVHRGGQGVVYQAIQESTRRKVAIKVLKHGPFADASEFARFDREVDVLSRLNHPHIVAIRDRGLTAGHAYYVMDYIPGRPVDAFVAGADMSIPDVLRLFVAICEAVNVAHLRGVIHRDLKPGNILVNEDGEPRILDFGLAKQEHETSGSSSEQAMTVTGQFIGSLPWASPEQAEGRTDSLDIRTDVYSLGVILYRLLTSRFPYPVTGQLSEVIRHITQTSPSRMSTAERRVDHDLELIVLKCLAKEPERRYQSAGELARDIRRYLAHDPVEARPASTVYHFKQFIRRNKTLAAAVAAVFIILAGATAGTTWALFQSKESNERATAINDFMRDVLTSVDPASGAADVRLIEVLATASASAPQRFAGRPLQEAEVHGLLGQVYGNLSMNNEARTEFERALRLWKEHAGPDDPRTLETAVNHLGNLVNMSRPGDAEKALDDLMPRLERVFADDDIRVLGARRVRAITLMFRGEQDEAERILLELRAHPALVGVDGDELQIRIIHSLNSIALRRMEQRPPDRAKILREIEPLARERVERATRRYGGDSPNLYHAQARLAQIACSLGRHQEAADLSREVLHRSVERLGECHYIRTEAMNVLSKALTGLRESREPAELRMLELACLRSRLAPSDPVFLSGLSDSLRFVERAGDGAGGEKLARELVEALGQFGGGHGDMLFGAELFLAEFISMQNRQNEAEPLFQSLRTREPSVQGRNARARFHLFWGHHLIRRGQFEDAEKALDTASQITGDARMGTWMTHPDDIILGYLALHEAAGNSDEVVRFRRLRDEAWTIAAGVDIENK